MNRTAERVLGIIGLVFTVFGLISAVLGAILFQFLNADPDFRSEIESEIITDPNVSTADVDMFFSLFNAFGGFMWLIVIFFVISLIVTIVGLVNIWNSKNPKLAGIMFILGGLTAGILSLTSILLYIAGILALTKKPYTYPEEQIGVEPHEQEDSMRPL